MVLIPPIQKSIIPRTRGKMGFTSGVGLARCGYSRCGASKIYGGIYQRKKLKSGWGVSRMRYYRPTNPQTESQQAWRDLMLPGWEAYRALTDDQKLVLSQQARRLRLSGPQLFMRRWLLEHR